MFYRETDGRRVITQHCALAGFVASHFMIPFYSMSAGILQQCLGGFSKPEGVSDHSISLSSCFHGNVLWWGKCTKTGPPGSVCLTLAIVQQATTVASASSLLLENTRV